ncbi:MAG: class C sortase [Lachnospiraceae bacterium]|nr:class C sortase [Lachnospiraceae bacterium]
MKWFRQNLVTILLVSVMAVGLCLILYPSFSDYWNSFTQSRIIMEYADNIANMNTEEYKRIISSAKQYNDELHSKSNRWSMTESELNAYMAELNIDGKGSMGYISIPKIDQRLPIYHGTSDNTLNSAIGHLEGTSLPVGGAGTHCVLSGHRGLPSARLFTDLDKMKEGDTFTMTILNEMLTYEVDQIKIIEPYDYAPLQIYEGGDYCTLMTCTPYGINTQRLLVRGRRIENPNGEAKVIADAIQIEASYVAPFIAVPMVLVLLFWMFLAERARRQDKILVERTRKSLNLHSHK